MADFDETYPVLVYSTAPSREVADRLARSMIEKKLAACVNMFDGMRSVYRWEGKIEEANEVSLLIKTTDDKLSSLQHFIHSEHPYYTPCCIEIPIEGGLPGYLQWLEDATR